MESLAIAAALLVAYGAVSGRLASTVVTAPMAFVAAGLLLGDGGGAADDAGLGRLPVAAGGQPPLSLAGRVRPRATASADHALDHRNSSHRMHWFSETRVQPGAGARGENDESNPFGSLG